MGLAALAFSSALTTQRQNQQEGKQSAKRHFFFYKLQHLKAIIQLSLLVMAGLSAGCSPAGLQQRQPLPPELCLHSGAADVPPFLTRA